MVIQFQRKQSDGAGYFTSTLIIDGQAWTGYGLFQELADQNLIETLGVKLRTAQFAAESILVNSHGAAVKAGNE